MRILHTSDWHVGKRLGRYDRLEEYEAAVAEVADIADRESAELVLVSGDLFDRPQPPVAALQIAFAGLARLAAGGERPVVVVAGNHDSPEYFEALAPFLATGGIHLVGAIKPPGEGGVLDIATGGGRALVACFPFLREGRVVDFMAATDGWYGQYADKVRRLTGAYADHLVRAGGDAVTLLVAHFIVTGARIGGHGLPRGERELHMGQAYTAAESAIPATLSYVAMGHIHAPQPVPSANVPAHYAGSLLQLDFGEAGEQKRVVVVDAEPGRPASVRSVPLSSGRPLVHAEGTWDELIARPELPDAYVDLVVDADGPEPGLADRAREAFPYLVRVKARYDLEETDRPARAGRPWPELYADYRVREYGAPPEEALAAAFSDVLDEVDHAPA